MSSNLSNQLDDVGGKPYKDISDYCNQELMVAKQQGLHDGEKGNEGATFHYEGKVRDDLNGFYNKYAGPIDAEIKVLETMIEATENKKPDTELKDLKEQVKKIELEFDKQKCLIERSETDAWPWLLKNSIMVSLVFVVFMLLEIPFQVNALSAFGLTDVTAITFALMLTFGSAFLAKMAGMSFKRGNKALSASMLILPFLLTLAIAGLRASHILSGTEAADKKELFDALTFWTVISTLQFWGNLLAILMIQLALAAAAYASTDSVSDFQSAYLDFHLSRPSIKEQIQKLELEAYRKTQSEGMNEEVKKTKALLLDQLTRLAWLKELRRNFIAFLNSKYRSILHTYRGEYEAKLPKNGNVPSNWKDDIEDAIVLA
jgi:hypothetical protein